MLDIQKVNFQGEASVAALLTSGSPGPPAPGCQQHQQQCVDANINICINIYINICINISYILIVNVSKCSYSYLLLSTRNLNLM